MRYQNFNGVCTWVFTKVIIHGVLSVEAQSEGLSGPCRPEQWCMKWWRGSCNRKVLLKDQSVNSHASKDYCKYQPVDDALLIQPRLFIAVVDLKSAYRSVHVRLAEHGITGLKWHFLNQSEPLIMCDTRLPFGACQTSAIFNRITQAVARSLGRDGHHVVFYLYDFFVCEPDFDSC